MSEKDNLSCWLIIVSFLKYKQAPKLLILNELSAQWLSRGVMDEPIS